MTHPEAGARGEKEKVPQAEVGARGEKEPGAAKLLTLGRVRQLLQAYGVRPRKSWGQNFLVEPSAARRIARLAEIRAGQTVLEPGAGLGSLTLALVEAGARVVAVELDPRLARSLRDLTRGLPVEVVEADASREEFSGLLEGPAAVVSTLPYARATAILLNLLRQGNLDPFTLTVQKELGERWSAGPGHPAYGAVSLKVASLATCRVVGRVSRRAFYPVPEVESVVVRLERKREPGEVPLELLWAVAEAAFRGRRKLLARSLAASGLEIGLAREVVARLGPPERLRCEDLDLEGYQALARELARAIGSEKGVLEALGRRVAS